MPGKCLLLTLIILENVCLLTQDSVSLEHHWKIMILPLSISCCKVRVVQNYLTRKAALLWVTNGDFHNLTLLLLKFYDKNLVKIYPRGKMILQTTDVKLAK